MKLEHIEIINKITDELRSNEPGGAEYKLGYGAGLTKAIMIIDKMVTAKVQEGMNPYEDDTEAGD